MHGHYFMDLENDFFHCRKLIWVLNMCTWIYQYASRYGFHYYCHWRNYI